MAKEKLTRPDAQDTKRMIEMAARIDRRLKAVLDEEAIQRQAAQQAAQSLYNHRIRETLEDMDIEHINKAKQGIRVSLLRDAGVQNVYQVSRMSFQQICDIDGLGDQSAWKIIDTVKQIVENTKDTIRIRIRVDNPSASDDALIRALYVLIHTRPLRKKCQQVYGANHRAVQNELMLAQQAQSGTGQTMQVMQQIITNTGEIQQIPVSPALPSGLCGAVLNSIIRNS